MAQFPLTKCSDTVPERNDKIILGEITTGKDCDIRLDKSTVHFSHKKKHTRALFPSNRCFHTKS